MEYNKVYSEIFKNKSYNSDNSLSYQKSMDFFEKVEKENNIDSIIDIGSGKGNLLKKLPIDKQIFSYDLECFYDKSILGHVLFQKLNLSIKKELESIKHADFLFCLDVLEHLEEEHIESILKTFSEKANFLFFTIANHSDIINGVELHLIQEDQIYWNEKINKYFKIISFETLYNNRLMLYGLIPLQEKKEKK